MKLITWDDFIDIYQKLNQRGIHFLLSKLNKNTLARTKSAFNNSAIESANWWVIPSVKKRWNKLITGHEDLIYEDYLMLNFLNNQNNLKLLSIGSGVCSHEIKLATYSNFSQVTCIDIADNLLHIAKSNADNLGLKNIEFLCEDLYKIDFNENDFDIILFHSSLHHFSNIQYLISNKIKKWLRPDGHLVINEYVGPNRLQFNETQIAYINKGLSLLPTPFKKRFKTNKIKRKFYGSGWLRMIIADPSECIESEQIKPVLAQQFNIVEERSYGGNILMSLLKDIAHHFIDENDPSVKSNLNKLFELEDEYLLNHESDFIFGIYKNNK